MGVKRILVFLLLIFLLGILSVYYPQLTGNITKTQDNYYSKETAILERAVDGDTIEARVGEEVWKIRVLGINTPEKNQPSYQEAKDFLKEFENKSIQLQRDGADTDMYKRKLRYLFYEDRFLDSEILKSGLANAYYTDGLTYEKQLLEAEQEARNSQAGIWKKSEDICSSCIVLEGLNYLNESFTIENSCNFDCALEGWFVKDAGRNIFHLENIPANSEETYTSKKEIWNNNGDKFFMFDKSGLLVIYYEY